jgi:hypothetical protein
VLEGPGGGCCAVKAAAEAEAAADGAEAVALALRMHSDALRLSHERHIPKAATT